METKNTVNNITTSFIAPPNKLNNKTKFLVPPLQKMEHIQTKMVRREKKRTAKRSITGEEVIYIFEKILEGWKTIRIYNTMIQLNPTSEIDKKKVESISTGNCKVYPSKLSPEKYEYYLQIS